MSTPWAPAWAQPLTLTPPDTLKPYVTTSASDTRTRAPALFAPPAAGDATATLAYPVFEMAPTNCPSAFAGCDHPLTLTNRTALEQNLGAGLGLRVAGLTLEYAQGAHFGFLGLGGEFHP